MLKILLVFTFLLISLIGLLVVVFVYWAPWPNWKQLPDPENTENEKVPEVAGTSYLRIMTWNIGFAGGEHGNPTMIYKAEEIESNLEKIKKTIREVDPDILFLQEVDRPSLRTGMIDEYRVLLDELGFRYGCFVTTWKCNYVPFPMTLAMEKQLGRVHSGQAVFSKFPIPDCRATVLPQPENDGWVVEHFRWFKKHMPFVFRAVSWLYNRYYIHRTIQELAISVGNGRFLHAFNCHLEAFDRANREQQAEILSKLVINAPSPMIVAGDMNTIPLDASQKRGFADEDIDFTNDNTLKTILKTNKLSDVFAGAPEDQTFTFPAYAPTRRLDYIFEDGFGLVEPCRVIKNAKGSDHLPLVVDIVLL